MRRHSLLRSTPFRLALAFAALFILSFLTSSFVAFDLIRADLNARYESRISEMFRVISQTYADSDAQDLIDATKAHIAATQNRQSLFLLQAPDGRVLAGNIARRPIKEGWSSLRSEQIGLDKDYSYRIFAGHVGPFLLAVGTSNEETGEHEEIVLASLGWASIVVLILAVAGGAFLGGQVQRRLDAVRLTLDQVAQGQLGARIPLLGKGDDVDLLSHDINGALERLAMTVEGMRQVSTDIAHDLKMPLNRLKIRLEGALEKQARGASTTDDLNSALTETDQINETFEALLRIAQIESGAQKARFANIDLANLLGALAAVYANVAEDMGHELIADINAPGGASMHGDRDLLMQMFANLIENAMRHCTRGSRIELKLRAGLDKIVVSVTDNGSGIPEAEREKVFRRLYRLEKSRSSPGTGLGLSLVKAIAELHDGTIALEDAAPGLRVVATFPAERRNGLASRQRRDE
jgi:signal transduction histidine kinase